MNKYKIYGYVINGWHELGGEWKAESKKQALEDFMRLNPLAKKTYGGGFKAQEIKKEA